MKKALTATLTAGAAAAALMGAGTAQADSNDVVFINVLDDRGIKPSGNDYTGMTRWGRAVCGSIADGNTVTEVVFALRDLSGELSNRDAGYFVGASISAYCPQYKRLVTG